MRKGLQYNSSGYYDSTALKAIKNVLAENKRKRILSAHYGKERKNKLKKGQPQNGIKR